MSVELKENPDVLRKKFFELTTPQDVADLLEIKYRRLNYHLEIVPPQEKYRIFYIHKKSGGMRTITSPISALRIIQSKLNQIFRLVYKPGPSIHGFVLNKSIVSNAQVHSGDFDKYILNLDLKDFFPSIHYDRVIQMFMVAPYNFGYSVAEILAKICCFNGSLPQGAPSSPIVSNMICAKLDLHLDKLAKQCNSNYTRYADDITFSFSSTSLEDMPIDLVTLINGKIELGSAIMNIILENGFEVNSKKVRLQTRSQRQEVTGLIVNGSRPNVKRNYIRQIRAMLYAWKKFGLDAAEKEHWERYSTKQQNPWHEPPSLMQVIRGKIDFLGMVRGKNDIVYGRLLNEYKQLLELNIKTGQVLNPNEKITQKSENLDSADIFSETIPANYTLRLHATGQREFFIDFEAKDGFERSESSKLPYSNDELTAILKALPFDSVKDAHLTQKQSDLLEQLGFLEKNNPIFLPGWDDKLGVTLFDSLFPGNIGVLIKSTIWYLAKPKKSIEIVLSLDSKEIDLSRYPWELIKFDETQQSLVINGAIDLVRYIKLFQLASDISTKQQISILYIESRPSGSEIDELPKGLEYDAVRMAFNQLKSEGVVSFENLMPPTFASLTNRIQKNHDTIFHFDGHGIMSRRCPLCKTMNYPHHTNCQGEGCGYSLDTVPARGYLAFEKSSVDHSVDWVDSKDIGNLLSNAHFGLAIVSACRSGETRGNSIFNSIGPSLIEAGVPAVVAMQMPITVNSAVEFMKGFYEALAESKPLASAIHSGRLNLIRSREWFIPVLYWHTRESKKPFFKKQT
jgi:RNA-directed DNA polymerase